MDNHEPHEIDPVTAFDTLYTSNQMQMLKIVLPFMQEKMPTENGRRSGRGVGKPKEKQNVP